MVILLDSCSVGSKQCPKVFDGTLSGLRPSCAAGLRARRQASGSGCSRVRARCERMGGRHFRESRPSIDDEQPNCRFASLAARQFKRRFQRRVSTHHHIPFCPCELHIRHDTITHKLGPVGEAVPFCARLWVLSRVRSAALRVQRFHPFGSQFSASLVASIERLPDRLPVTRARPDLVIEHIERMWCPQS